MTIAALMLLIAAPQLEVVDNGRKDAQKLLESCSEILEGGVPFCSVDIAAFRDTVLRKAWDAQIPPPFCISEPINYHALVKSVIRTAEEKPKLAKGSRAKLIFEALKKDFACPKGIEWSPYQLNGTFSQIRPNE